MALDHSITSPLFNKEKAELSREGQDIDQNQEGEMDVRTPCWLGDSNGRSIVVAMGQVMLLKNLCDCPYYSKPLWSATIFLMASSL
jgi:hypothetical protein